MHKFKLWHLAVISVAVFLVFGIIAAVVVLSNDELHDINKWEFSWNNPSRGLIFGSGKDYTIDKNESLDITNKSSISVSGISSDINIVQSTGSELKAHLYGEYTSRNGEIELEVENTSTTIKIIVKYPRSGVTRSNMTLDIEIPSNYSGDLSVSSVSSDIELECDDMAFGDISVNSVSGMTQLNSLSSSKVNVNTVSGDIKGTVKSGEVDINGISSSVELYGLTETVSVNTVSGDVSVWVDKYGNIKVDTVSGSVKINLETKDDFYVKFDSTSGDFECNVPLTIIRQKNSDFEGYAGKENSSRFEVDSVSGDLTITQ